MDLYNSISTLQKKRPKAIFLNPSLFSKVSIHRFVDNSKQSSRYILQLKNF